MRSGAKRAGLSGKCGYSRPCWFCFPGAEREAGRLGEEGRRGVGWRAGPANQDAASARAALPALSRIPGAFSSGSYTLGGVSSLKNEVFPECTFVQGHGSMEVTAIWLLRLHLCLHPFNKYPVSPLGQTLSQM